MPKQLNQFSTPYYRHTRFTHLKDALQKISFFKIYNGAHQSTSIDFNGAYNNPDQLTRNGARTPEDIGKQARDELADAKTEFREACRNCEFKKVCGSKSDKEAIFWQFVDDPKARQRFRSRIGKRDFTEGLASASCTRLLQPTRLKKSEIL